MSLSHRCTAWGPWLLSVHPHKKPEPSHCILGCILRWNPILFFQEDFKMHFKMHSYPLFLSYLLRLKFHNSNAHNEMNNNFSDNHLLKSSTGLPTADASACFSSWKISNLCFHAFDMKKIGPWQGVGEKEHRGPFGKSNPRDSSSAPLRSIF